MGGIGDDLDQARDANVGQGRQASFEYAVRIAASMAKFACANNIPTRLFGEGRAPLYQPAGTGQGHYQQLLDGMNELDSEAQKILNPD